MATAGGNPAELSEPTRSEPCAHADFYGEGSALVDRRHLEYFLALADRGSISAAARGLGVSQPTISEALARMEKECGLALVRRGSRGVTLTDAGRDLTGPAAQVLRAYRDLDHALHPLNVVQRGRLTVVCPRTLARDPAATALGAFTTRFPNVAVTMLSNDTDGIGMVVASGQADVGIGVDEVFDEGVERILLGRQRIVALVPSARSSGEGADELTDLLRIGLIASPRGDVTRRLLAERLGERTVDEAVVAETISAASMIPLVRAGVGVAFLPESVADAVGEGVVLRRTRPPLSRDLWMFHGSTPSPAAQAFIETTTRLRDEGGLGNAG